MDKLFHVIEAQQFGRPLLTEIFSVTKEMEEVVSRYGSSILKQRIMARLFYEPITRTEIPIDAKELGKWLADNFRGYCYQRQHTIDRPLFAKLIDCRDTANNSVEAMDQKATDAGFINLASTEKPESTDLIPFGKYHYYRALRAAGSTNDATGRRTVRMGRYYTVSVCPVSKFSMRSNMRYDEFWGTTLEHAAIESEACVLLSSTARQLAFDRPKRRRLGSGTARDLPKLVEKIGEDGCKRFDDLFVFGDEAEAVGFASRLLRLVQTTLACNELFRDAGKNNRTTVAREDVFSAQKAAAVAVMTYQ